MSTGKPDPSLTPPYVDLPTLREIYADHCRLTTFDGHSFHIELAIHRPTLTGENQSEPVIYPVARLVLSPSAGLQLHELLSRTLAKLQQTGQLKHVGPTPGTKQ